LKIAPSPSRFALGRGGQAMTEYAIILAVLSLALVAPIDGSNGFMSMAIKAYRDYYVSYYYVLNLPFP
jgi:Flp pilus assembly pilin Flp